MPGLDDILDLLNKGGTLAAAVMFIIYLIRENNRLRKERDSWVDRAWQGTDLADKAVDVAADRRRRPR